jgi:hypothetical protein
MAHLRDARSPVLFNRKIPSILVHLPGGGGIWRISPLYHRVTVRAHVDFRYVRRYA